MHANIAVFWAEHVIKILNHHGVHHFCLAPGARSTPLVMALSHNKHVKVTTHFDERALGFFALGVAKATESPVAIITTSGSAVANLLPSAVEATHAHVPLIFLTADRPQELQNCGANQAINQEAIFGTFVKKFEALPVPSPAIELSAMFPSIPLAPRFKKTALNVSESTKPLQILEFKLFDIKQLISTVEIMLNNLLMIVISVKLLVNDWFNTHFLSLNKAFIFS